MSTMTRRVAMITTTALLGAAALTGPTAATASAADAGGVVGEGSFTWGINTTFLGHLASPVAGGQLTGLGGATFAAGEFTLPVNAERSTLDGGTVRLVLDGGMALKAYEGMGPGGGWGLDIVYEDLVLELSGREAVLIGDYELSGSRNGGTEPTAGEGGDDVALISFTLPAPLDPADGTFAATGLETYAAPGIAESLGRYEVGAPMAPVALALTYAEGGAAGGAGSGPAKGPLSSTLSSSSSDGTLAARVGAVDEFLSALTDVLDRLTDLRRAS